MSYLLILEEDDHDAFEAQRAALKKIQVVCGTESCRLVNNPLFENLNARRTASC
jgi:hypothetical protein